MITVKNAELELQAAKEANAQLLEQLHELQAECNRNDLAANVTHDVYMALERERDDLRLQNKQLENVMLDFQVSLENLLALYELTIDQLKSDDPMDDAREIGGIIDCLQKSGIDERLINAMTLAAGVAVGDNLGAWANE